MKAHLVTRIQIEQGVKQLRSNIFRDVKLSRLRLRSTDFLKKKMNNIQILNRSINTSLVICRICVLKVQVSNQRRIQDCCHIQGGALCDNSYYHKELQLGCSSSPRSVSSNFSEKNPHDRCLLEIFMKFFKPANFQNTPG